MTFGTRLVVPPPGVSPWAAMLREVEGHADRAGWDQPTSLFWIDWLDGADGGMSGLGVLQPPLSPMLGQLAPYQLLDALADLWQGPGPAGAVAIAVVFEVWAASSDPGRADADRAAVAERRLQDEPHAREMRVAMITRLDPLAGVRLLKRYRGGEPGPVGGSLGEGDLRLVAAALRKLAVAVSTCRRHTG